MSDLEAIRERWIAERPMYEALGFFVQDRLERETRRRGLLCEHSARAKDVDSLLKKALRKRYDLPYAAIHDKAGVRVVVTYADDVTVVDNIVQDHFHIHVRENKTLGLPPNQLGYLGVHFEASIPDGDVPETKQE